MSYITDALHAAGRLLAGPQNPGIEVHKIKLDRSPGAQRVYEAMLLGLKKMEREGVDRVVLALQQTGLSESARGRWLEEKDHAYYPFEALTNAEREMILDGRSYRAIAVVLGGRVCGTFAYDVPTAEVMRRTGPEHLVPALPREKPESLLNYITEREYTGNIDGLLEDMAAAGITAEAVERAVKDGIREYKQITARLLEGHAGLQAALRSMDKLP